MREGGLESVLPPLGLKSVEEMWANIGYGKLSAQKVAGRLVPEVLDDMLEGQLRRFLAAPVGQGRPDRFGAFQAGDIVAAGTAIFVNRAQPNVSQDLVRCDRLQQFDGRFGQSFRHANWR